MYRTVELQGGDSLRGEKIVVVFVRDGVAELIFLLVSITDDFVLPLVRVPALWDIVAAPCVVGAQVSRLVGAADVVVRVVGLEVVAPSVEGWGLAVASCHAKDVACDTVLGLFTVLFVGWNGFGVWTCFEG